MELREREGDFAGGRGTGAGGRVGSFGHDCFALSGLRGIFDLDTQGASLGYRITPRWGLDREDVAFGNLFMLR